MFGSNILDIALGLIFVFLLLSLICSAANEIIELALKKRAKDLERGIGELIGDPRNAQNFLQAIYDHGLINGLYRGTYKPGSSSLPSYIPSRNFALALIEIYQKADLAANSPRNSESQGNTNSPTENSESTGSNAIPVASAGKTSLKEKMMNTWHIWSPKQAGQLAADRASKAVVGIPTNVQTVMDVFTKTADDVKKLQASVEAWYDSAMDRVSGWYKRRTQCLILVLGLVIAAAINGDCIEIAQRLSKDASLRQGIVALAEATAKKDQPKDEKTTPVEVIKDKIDTLQGLGLPIGWDPISIDQVTKEAPPWRARMCYAIAHHWLGWVLTALAVSLGAPFWFDMLNKIIVVRSTVKPHEKSKEEGSKDSSRATEV